MLEALKNLTLVRFKPDRDGAGAKATILLAVSGRETQVWWRVPPVGERMTLHFRPYPEGWERLSHTEQDETSKEVAVAIVTRNAETSKGARGRRGQRR